MTDDAPEHQGQSRDQFDVNPFSDPAAPLNVHVRLECWDGDYATQIGSIDEMNVTMIERWNALVGPGTVVLHLGDLPLGPTETSVGPTNRLNGALQGWW